jgi:hypothetical protein
MIDNLDTRLWVRDYKDEKCICPDVWENIEATVGLVNNTVDLVSNWTVEKCPSCWNPLYEWICEFGCWYINDTHLSDYEEMRSDQELERYIEKFEKLNGNGEKIEVAVMWLWKHIHYFNYKSRIKPNEWLIEFEDDGEIYKVFVWYKFSEINDHQWDSQINLIIKDKNIEFKNQKWLRWKLKVLKKANNKQKKWYASYYDFSKLKKIIKSILNDANLNPHVIGNNSK